MYRILGDILEQWYNHVLAEELRSQPVQYEWDCSMNYKSWFHSVSHPCVQDLAKRQTGPLRLNGHCFSTMRVAIVNAAKLLQASLKDNKDQKVKDALELLCSVQGPVLEKEEVECDDRNNDIVQGNDSSSKESEDSSSEESEDSSPEESDANGEKSGSDNVQEAGDEIREKVHKWKKNSVTKAPPKATVKRASGKTKAPLNAPAKRASRTTKPITRGKGANRYRGKVADTSSGRN
ncbi:hypothetical protein FRX31_021107 [Thalictrum thalictroides]|uniref:Uncharacterized protein n=1 Tax=Thalictrum thalictroides TaxID=46969 RepID=A0A7J6VW19_THATH|nr:hypothetical protein FRX31_021107 [Thalictrum thalictroides]